MNSSFSLFWLHYCVVAERTSDKAHPHKKSNVSGPAHLHLRPQPPQGFRAVNKARGKGDKFVLTPPCCVAKIRWNDQSVFVIFQKEKKKQKGTKQTDNTAEEEVKEEEEEEEIPQLVPIETPIKKPKLEVSAVHSCWILKKINQQFGGNICSSVFFNEVDFWDSFPLFPSQKPEKKKQQLKKAPKPSAVKTGTKAQNKLTKKAIKTEAKVKRKTPKVKWISHHPPNLDIWHSVHEQIVYRTMVTQFIYSSFICLNEYKCCYLNESLALLWFVFDNCLFTAFM